MKLRTMLFGVLAALFVSVALTGCKDDDEDPKPVPPPDPVENTHHAMLLNEGSWGYNNASITGFYWNTNELFDTECVYKLINDQAVGDVGQDLIRDSKGNVYLVVYGSAYIAKLDDTGKEICRTDLTSGELATLGQPRYAVLDGDYLYVSCYGNCVAKFKADDLTYVSKVEVGNNPERLTILNGKIYCTSSVDENYTADNRLAVIDLKTFNSATFFTPMSNMDRILNVNGKIYVQGYGDYYDYPWGEVNTSTGEFTQIGNASCWAENGGVIYTVNSVTDWSTYATTNYFATYDTATGKLTAEEYLVNVPEELASTSVYSMNFNPYNHYLYVMTSDFVNNGKVYVFDNTLTYVTTFTTTGINPKTIVFFE